jgi:hypothetical protein
MGLEHSVMGLSPSWPQCGYATTVNDHCKQPSFFVINDWGTAGRDRLGRLASTDTKIEKNKSPISIKESGKGFSHNLSKLLLHFVQICHSYQYDLEV